jgi:hypothetical protein
MASKLIYLAKASGFPAGSISNNKIKNDVDILVILTRRVECQGRGEQTSSLLELEEAVGPQSVALLQISLHWNVVCIALN